MWEDVDSRLQAANVLRLLSDWAKDSGTDEFLLHVLINSLAEANRVAYSKVIDSLAYFFYSDKKLDALPKLLSLPEPDTHIDNDLNFEIQKVFLESVKRHAFSRSHILNRLGINEDELDLVLNSASKGWRTTCESLSYALTCLSQPPDAVQDSSFNVMRPPEP